MDSLDIYVILISLMVTLFVYCGLPFLFYFKKEYENEKQFNKHVGLWSFYGYLFFFVMYIIFDVHDINGNLATPNIVPPFIYYSLNRYILKKKFVTIKENIIQLEHKDENT